MTGPGTTDSSKEAPAPDARRPDASTFHHREFTWAPLVVWLAAQILILLVPASQVRLADEFPRPAESMALREMLAGQMVIVTLTFPFLLRGAAVSIAIAASAWPFLLLAGVLASTPNQRIGGCALYLTVWIAVLAIWRTVLRTHALQMVGVAVGGALSVGLPLL